MSSTNESNVWAAVFNILNRLVELELDEIRWLRMNDVTMKSLRTWDVLRRLPTVQPISGHLGHTSALINISISGKYRVEMCKSDPKPIRIRSDPIGFFRISDQVRSFRIGSDRIKLFCSRIGSDRIGLEPDFQLLELEKESSSVKVDASGLVFWSS